MSLYVIIFEIKKGAKTSFIPLFDEIKKKSWWHYMSNSYIVKSNETANELFNRLKPHLNKEIILLVFELGKDRQGWLTEQAWEWIRENKTQN